MLPRSARLTRGEAFRLAVRKGTRAGSRTLVLHWLADEDAESSEVGFVVSKAVGNSVVRNRVKRRLRHLTREHLEELPGRGVLVVRANPAAAGATHPALDADLAKALHRLRPKGAGS